MVKVIALFASCLTGLSLQAQELMKQVMEKRAQEMHRVICLSDKDQWKKFIRENYTQALIDKPMRSQISKSDDSGSSSEKKDIGDALEGKVGMFQRLHNDFGDSKIVSIKQDGEKLEMELSGPELNGVFKLKFNGSKPFLIEGLGIQVEAGNH